jgi:hypothetical protein
VADLLEFGSDAWIDSARKVIERIVAEAPDDQVTGVRFAICEVYTDVPEHIEPDADGRRAWHLRIRGREAELRPGEIEDADLKIVGEYAAILPISRLHYRNDPGALKKSAELGAQAVREGRLSVSGDQRRAPGFLAGFHDALAEITA